MEKPSGILLRHSSRGPVLEVLREGRGVSIALPPEDARALAAQLLVMADAHEARALGEAEAALALDASEPSSLPRVH